LLLQYSSIRFLQRENIPPFPPVPLISVFPKMTTPLFSPPSVAQYPCPSPQLKYPRAQVWIFEFSWFLPTISISVCPIGYSVSLLRPSVRWRLLPVSPLSNHSLVCFSCLPNPSIWFFLPFGCACDLPPPFFADLFPLMGPPGDYTTTLDSPPTRCPAVTIFFPTVSSPFLLERGAPYFPVSWSADFRVPSFLVMRS